MPLNRKLCHPSSLFLLGAASNYGGPLVSIIQSVKFNSIRQAAAPLARLLIAYSEQTNIIPGRAVVVPIPLGRRRMRERGFNQAALLAAPLAEHFSLVYEPSLLARGRNTRPQSNIARAAERRENIAGCFVAPNPRAVSGKTILLVDDVVTSGSTLREAALTLKQAGAHKIIALVAAKA